VFSFFFEEVSPTVTLVWSRFDLILTGTSKDAAEEDPADRLESDDSAGVR
jgi:hypothetical protein